MSGPSIFPKRTQPASGLFRLISTWFELSRERRALAALDDRMLKDIGISRATATHEARKPFWDVPKDRRSGELSKGTSDCGYAPGHRGQPIATGA